VENEKARATVEKYVQEAEQLRLALCGAPVTKAGVLAYRERLQQQYRALTVNNKLSAVNAYLRFCGAEHCEVKLLKVQRRAFREEQRDLTESEYRRLLSIAKGRKNQRLYHVMLTICATGIRVSELRFITAEALRAGRTEIRLKGKCRTVLLPQELAERLRRYARAQDIQEGPLFRTRTGRPLDRSNIWHEMKTLCREAGVMPEKVFPHNLRHLFAKCFYEQEKDLAHLADLLGHSSIETTRIYVAVSARAHEQILEKMRLIV
jgi:integrase